MDKELYENLGEKQDFAGENKTKAEEYDKALEKAFQKADTQATQLKGEYAIAKNYIDNHDIPWRREPDRKVTAIKVFFWAVLLPLGLAALLFAGYAFYRVMIF